jgi:hypothetical protein
MKPILRVVHVARQRGIAACAASLPGALELCRSLSSPGRAGPSGRTRCLCGRETVLSLSETSVIA